MRGDEERSAGADLPRGGRAALRAVLSGLVAVGILALLFRALVRSWRDAGVYQWSMNGWWIAAAFLALAVYFPLVAWIWRRLVRALGEEISFRDACRVWFLAQLGKYVPGKIWFAMGRIALSRGAGVSVLTASASTLLELLLVLLAAAAVFLASVPLWPGIAGHSLFLLPIAVLLILVLIHPAVFALLLLVGARLLRHGSVPRRVPWRTLASNCLWYAASWLVYGLGIDLLLRGIRLEGVPAGTSLAAPGRLLWIAGAAAVAWSIGFLSLLAPGGLGVREASFAYLLSMHLPAPFPILLALLARVWIVIGETATALVGWRLKGGRS
jgi:hypothetical protein